MGVIVTKGLNELFFDVFVKLTNGLEDRAFDKEEEF